MGHISTAAAQHYYRQKSAKVAPLTSSNSQPYVEVTGAQLPITPISSGQPLYNYPYGLASKPMKECCFQTRRLAVRARPGKPKIVCRSSYE
jgi:hypothetical protein